MKEMVGIDVKQVLRMNDGVGETSYSKTSYIQALSMSKSIKEEAIKEFYKKQGNTTSPKCLWIADFGCSSVELSKTSAIYELIAIVEKTCKQIGQNPPLEYQIALNDLPNNDFNTVFKSVPSLRDLLKEKMRENFGQCFVGAFPGSFYGRLFPSNTLHFVHSSFSLHWLSQALSMSKSIKEEAIKEFYKKQGNTTSPKCLWIADFGCSSVELSKTSAIYELIAIVEKTCKQIGQNPPLEYQIALNDLPNNDFNTVFKSLPSLRDLLKEKMRDNFGHCFVGAFPGSFYGRLFPSNTLHFVHSSFSLHWLSQVPKGIEENKGNIFIGKTSTPKVLKAYFDQFQNDFLTFLRYRSEEMVPGGIMLITLLGRRNNESYNKVSSQAYDLLALVLNDMVKEGYIDENKEDEFNIPAYKPSPEELEKLVQKEGSFNIINVQVYEIDWISKEFGACDFVKCIRSVFEPLLISHFGNLIIQVFDRYQDLIIASLATQPSAYTIHTVSLSRRL